MLDRKTNFVAVDNNDSSIMAEEHTKKDEKVHLTLSFAFRKIQISTHPC